MHGERVQFGREQVNGRRSNAEPLPQHRRGRRPARIPSDILRARGHRGGQPAVLPAVQRGPVPALIVRLRRALPSILCRASSPPLPLPCNDRQQSQCAAVPPVSLGCAGAGVTHMPCRANHRPEGLRLHSGGSMSAQSTNLFLLEDLEDIARTSGFAASDLDALQAVADWIKTYVVKPHKDLGRAGAVCPFVPEALKRKTLWLTPEPSGRSTKAMRGLRYTTRASEHLDRPCRFCLCGRMSSATGSSSWTMRLVQLVGASFGESATQRSC